MEDTIELYITDMAYRRDLRAEESTTDFEEARMFKAHEEVSHGHFRKWRRAMERRGEVRIRLGARGACMHDASSVRERRLHCVLFEPEPTRAPATAA